MSYKKAVRAAIKCCFALAVYSWISSNSNIKPPFKTTKQWKNWNTKPSAMAKFQVLQSNQAFMAKLGLYSYRLTEPTNDSSFITFFMIFYMATFNVSASAAWIFLNFDQLVPVLDTCRAIIVSLQAIGMFINASLKMKTVKKLHRLLQHIVDKGRLINIYLTSNQFVRNRQPFDSLKGILWLKCMFFCY